MKKINQLFIAILSCILVLLAQTSQAQQIRTGVFDTVINFQGTHDTLCYYVPPNYNPANKYRLVISLHGLGDTPDNMRNYFLKSILSSDTLGLVNNTRSPLYDNTIVLCPYMSGINTDIWEPVGDTALITTCMAEAESVYNIDPHYIYLNGFSVGARGALRYGLLNYWRFRGLELWTPAIQDMDEANDLTTFYYPWENGRYIPIYISLGGADSYYPPYVATGYQHLADTGAIVDMQIVFGLPHAPPPDENEFMGFNYIDSHASSYAMNDAGVSAIVSPTSGVCSTSFSPVVNIQNIGVNNLTSVTVNYQIDNGSVSTYSWSGNLIRLGVDKVTLPLQNVSAGTHTFSAYTSMPNGVTDAVPSNDAMTESFTSTGAVTLAEGFEGQAFPPAGWTLAGTDSAWGWELARKNGGEFTLFSTFESGAYGNSNSCIYFDNEAINHKGKRYSIRTPIWDLSGISNPTLQYDYAYAPYDKYFSDTLAVYYSVDCGNTWDTLLVKGGLALSTVGGYDSTTILFPNSSSIWMHQIINLNQPGIVGQHEVMFSFENRSGYGDFMYLDNISDRDTNVTGIATEVQQQALLNVYPNPSNGNITAAIAVSNETNVILKLYNMEGQLIYSQEKDKYIGVYQINIDLSNQAKGIYILNMITDKGMQSKKIIIE